MADYRNQSVKGIYTLDHIFHSKALSLEDVRACFDVPKTSLVYALPLNDMDLHGENVLSHSRSLFGSLRNSA